MRKSSVIWALSRLAGFMNVGRRYITMSVANPVEAFAQYDRPRVGRSRWRFKRLIVGYPTVWRLTTEDCTRCIDRFSIRTHRGVSGQCRSGFAVCLLPGLLGSAFGLGFGSKQRLGSFPLRLG